MFYLSFKKRKVKSPSHSHQAVAATPSALSAAQPPVPGRAAREKAAHASRPVPAVSNAGGGGGVGWGGGGGGMGTGSGVAGALAACAWQPPRRLPRQGVVPTGRCGGEKVKAVCKGVVGGQRKSPKNSSAEPAALVVAHAGPSIKRRSMLNVRPCHTIQTTEAY